MAKSKVQEIGKNVAVQVEGDKLTITVDLSEKTVASGSGKTLIIASSQGNKKVTDEVFIGLNVYKYKEPKKGK